LEKCHGNIPAKSRISALEKLAENLDDNAAQQATAFCRSADRSCSVISTSEASTGLRMSDTPHRVPLPGAPALQPGPAQGASGRSRAQSHARRKTGYSDARGAGGR